MTVLAVDDKGTKRVTVTYSGRDWRAIRKAMKRLSKERGYTVSISMVLRELVNNNLK